MKRYAVLCGEYVAPCLDGTGSIIGATHEHKESMLTSKPNVATAASLLNPKVGKLLELENDNTLLSQCRRAVCGNRVSSPRTHLGKLPIVGNIFDNVWVVTGMGSRGLLYHVYIGRILAEAIIRHETIPTEINCKDRLKQ